MPAFEQDPFSDIPITRPRTAPRPMVSAAPPMATPQAPGQDAASYGSAAASGASAERTRALTPVELEHMRLENAGTSRQVALERARLEAVTNQLLTVGNHYNRSYRDSDYPVSMPDWLSGENSQFNSEAAAMAEQGFAQFRIPGVGTQSDADALRFAQANQPSAQGFDSANEAKLDALTARLNANRAVYGMDPIDWRQAPVSTPVQATQQANPNLAQPGEHMAGVGTLPIVSAPGDVGHNELNNAGGSYATERDIANSDAIARQATELARRTGNPQIVSDFMVRMGRQPLTMDQTRTLNAWRRRYPNRMGAFPGYYAPPETSGHSDPNLTTGMANTGYGAGVIAAGDAMTFGLLDNATADPERTRAGMEMLREQHPWESAAGEMAGSLVPGVGIERGVGYGLRAMNEMRGVGNVARGAGEMATLGEMAVRPTSNAIYGGAYGSGSADQNGGGFMERAAGAGRGALMSVAGGEVGDRFTAGLGRAATGSRNAAVRRLTDLGVPLTIGDIANNGGVFGRTVSRVQNVLESVPALGDAIRARRGDSREGLARATFNETLAPIGANTGGVIGEEGVDLARTATNNAYREALDNVRVQPDNAFNVSLDNVTRHARNLPPDLQSDFARFIQNRVAPALKNGNMTGSAYQALRQDIRQRMAAVSGQLGEQEYSNVLKRTDAALSGLLRRQSPQTRASLRAADQAYRRTRVNEGAVASSVTNAVQPGIPTPNQLGSAARSNASRYGGNAATTSRPFYQLQRDAQKILPSTLPNSGTVDRAWVLQAFPAALAGGAYQAGLIDPGTAALFAGLGLPYTRTGQRAFQKLLVNRPEVLRRVGETIIAQRRWGARAGSGAVNPITDQTPNPSGR